ncbi:MAG: hypothetical protein JWO80_6230 [Bryobacterales bacterium]|nr:hypothetical protein [Bryobacterales bacterium]
MEGRVIDNGDRGTQELVSTSRIFLPFFERSSEVSYLPHVKVGDIVLAQHVSPATIKMQPLSTIGNIASHYTCC